MDHIFLNFSWSNVLGFKFLVFVICKKLSWNQIHDGRYFCINLLDMPMQISLEIYFCQK